MDVKETLFELCRLCGPSGFEDEVGAYCEKKLGAYSADVRRDPLGNTIASIPCGKPGAKKLLLDAHIDELGLIVSSHEDGFLRFELIGGIDPRILPGREITILAEEKIFGVVSCLPPHVLSAEQMEKPIPVKDMVIDAGLSAEEAKKRVPIGTPAVYRDEPRELAGNLLCGKAMDDRSCFAALLRALELLKGRELAVDLYVMAGVQEEVFMRGAGPAAFDLAPDYAIVVDVTNARTPDSKEQVHLELGKGPTLSIGPNTDRRFTRFIGETGQKQGIPLQYSVHTRNSGTNAYPIQVSRGGVVSAIIELPAVYLHTPVECVRLDDLEHTAALIAAAVERLGEFSSGGSSWK
jgi:endoglucanase